MSNEALTTGGASPSLRDRGGGAQESNLPGGASQNRNCGARLATKGPVFASVFGPRQIRSGTLRSVVWCTVAAPWRHRHCASAQVTNAARFAKSQPAIASTALNVERAELALGRAVRGTVAGSAT